MVDDRSGSSSGVDRGRRTAARVEANADWWAGFRDLRQTHLSDPWDREEPALAEASPEVTA